MCGRFVGAFSAEVLMDEMLDALSEAKMTITFGEDSLLAPNYNTAPTHIVPILRNEESNIVVDPMQWGSCRHGLKTQVSGQSSSMLVQRPLLRSHRFDNQYQVGGALFR